MKSEPIEDGRRPLEGGGGRWGGPLRDRGSRERSERVERVFLDPEPGVLIERCLGHPSRLGVLPEGEVDAAEVPEGSSLSRAIAQFPGEGERLLVVLPRLRVVPE